MLTKLQCAERFYGVVAGGKSEDEEEDGSVDDIEKSILKEVSNQKTTPKLFKSAHIDIPCVLFFKTRSPVEPIDFVHRICQEVVSNPDIRKMRYVNRLTPMTLLGKATEKGLEDVVNAVLIDHFQMGEKTNGEASERKNGEHEEAEDEYASVCL